MSKTKKGSVIYEVHWVTVEGGGHGVVFGDTSDEHAERGRFLSALKDRALLIMQMKITTTTELMDA